MERSNGSWNVVNEKRGVTPPLPWARKLSVNAPCPVCRCGPVSRSKKLLPSSSSACWFVSRRGPWARRGKVEKCLEDGSADDISLLLCYMWDYTCFFSCRSKLSPPPMFPYCPSFLYSYWPKWTITLLNFAVKIFLIYFLLLGNCRLYQFS